MVGHVLYTNGQRSGGNAQCYTLFVRAIYGCPIFLYFTQTKNAIDVQKNRITSLRAGTLNLQGFCIYPNVYIKQIILGLLQK